MRTCSQAHLPIIYPSMSSEPVPIAHISNVVNIEEDFLSQETPEVEEEIKPMVQDKSPVVPIDDLISTLRTFGNPSSKSRNVGRIKEPEIFTGRDSKKLKAFIFQCCLYFWGSSKFDFALSYLWDIAQEWFKPGISSITDDYPNGLTAGIYLLRNSRIILVLSTSLLMLSTNSLTSG